MAEATGTDPVALEIVLRLLAGYDFSAYHRIVDVEQQHVTATVTPTERLEVVAGDFFEDVVPAGDLYMMKSIIHDWPDDEAVAILRS